MCTWVSGTLQAPGNTDENEAVVAQEHEGKVDGARLHCCPDSHHRPILDLQQPCMQLTGDFSYIDD